MFGHNSKETCQGAVYDIQTQDLQDPKIFETHVYRNGKILASVRTSYTENEPESSLEKKLSAQHAETCEKVREGIYSLIFLWISRGVIAFEENEYLSALEYFESVLSMDETQEEANLYLNKIRVKLDQNAAAKQEILQNYQKQVEHLLRSGRSLEAVRKENMLARLFPPTRPLPPQKTDVDSRTTRIPASLWNRLINRVYFQKQLLVTTASILLILCAGVIFTDAQVRLDPDYHFHLGKSYLKENRTLPARNIFYSLLRQNPSSDDAFLLFWETFRRQGDYRVAAGILEESLGKELPPPRTHFYLAEAYRMTSRIQEAQSQYQQALREGWPETACKIGMGLCFLTQRNPSAAIDLWETLQEKGNQDYRIDYCLGLAHQASGRPGLASGFFLKALRKKPDSAPIYRALSFCLQSMHQGEKAQELLAKADRLSLNQETACPANPMESGMRSNEGSSDSTPWNCFPFPLL